MQNLFDLSHFKQQCLLLVYAVFLFLSRFSKGKRSNLRGSSVKSLNFIAEEESVPEASTSETTTQPKRTTRKNKQTKSEVTEEVSQSTHGNCITEKVENRKPELIEELDKSNAVNDAKVEPDYAPSTPPKTPSPGVVVSTSPADPSPPKIPSPDVVVSISPTDRLSAEIALQPEPSPGRTAAKIAIAGAAQSSRRSSVRCSLKLRHSRAGLRHSMTQESVRRASRRSMLKRKVSRVFNSTSSSNAEGDELVIFCL